MQATLPSYLSWLGIHLAQQPHTNWHVACFSRTTSNTKQPNKLPLTLQPLNFLMCGRCIQAWKAALKRRKQLDRQALVVGRVVAANKTAACFHAWLAWVRTRQRHRRLLATGMQQTAAMTKLSALSRWRWWVVERQREVEVCEQVSL